MQQRRGTAAQWTSANPTLAAGEIGFETDTNKFKLGNGSSAWSSLQYFVDASIVFDSAEVQGLIDTAVNNLIDGAPGTLNTLNELASALNDNENYSAYVTNTFSSLSADIVTLQNQVANTNSTAATLAETVATGATNLTTHSNLTINVHGISNTAALVYNDNVALTNERTPTDGSVSEGKLASSAVTNAKIAADAVDGSKIADDAVAAEHIADEAITNAHISNTAAIAQSKVSGLTSDLAAKLDVTTASSTYAPLASPALTGTPTSPTASSGTNTTQIATTEFVQSAISAVVGAAPAALDTLNEIAEALNDDASYANTIVSSLALKAPIASPTFTGTVTVAASGIAFTDGTQTKEGVPSRTTINSASESYNLSTGGLALRDTLIEVNSAYGCTVTIPTNATTAYPVGTSIDLLQTGAGQVTIAGASGVTVNGTPGLKLRTQWSSATIFKRAENSWVVMGDLSV